MNSYADKTQNGESHAIANDFSARRNENEKYSAQFHAPNIIQRYTIVQPDNIKAQQGATIETQDIERTPYGSTYVNKSDRVTQTGFNPPTQETTTAKESGAQNQQVSSLPSFKVSKSGFLAVAAEGQAKNLYANDMKVQESNQVLAANGSKIRLATQGAGITVPKTPLAPRHGKNKVRNLKKVHAAMPVNVGGGQIQNQVQQTLPDVQCNDFIQLVLGAATTTSRIAVLENEEDNIRGELKAPEPDEPISEVATIVSEARISPEDFVGEINDRDFTDGDKETGKRDYESLTHKERKSRAKKLGINEFANPEVGEGYVIRSMETTAKLDANQQGVVLPAPQVVPNNNKTKKQRRSLREKYLQAITDLDNANAIVDKSRLNVSHGVQTMMQTWGEHYAGVVAKDGSDTVTLENYNRSTEVSWEHERIFNNLFRDFAEFRNLVSMRVTSLSRTPSEAVIQQLVALAAQVPNLQQNYQNALQEATQSFQTGLAQANHTFNEQFYFDMYGPDEQSFHSKFKGAASNPVTLRVTEDVNAVRQGALDTITELHTTIGRWEVPLLAHPVTVPLTNTFAGFITAARLAEVTATNNLQNAVTRGEIGMVITAADLATNTLRNQMRATVIGAYQTITGNAPVPQIFGGNDIVARCTAFRNTYSWYNRADDPYNQSLALQNLATALTAAHLI